MRRRKNQMNQRRYVHIGWVVVAAICLAGMIVSDAQAFDGHRRGFFLGGGLGPGFTAFKQTIEEYGESASSDWETKVSFFTDIKIGYAPDERHMIYYFSDASWFGLDNMYGSTVTLANGVDGLGMTIYFQPKAPSPYVNFGIGLASWNAVSESNADTWYGFGIMAGAGYEFARHWSLEGTLTYGHPTKTIWDTKVSTDAIAFGVKIIALAY